MKSIKSIIISILTLMIFAQAQWVAKVNNNTISTKEFQQYIDFRKEAVGDRAKQAIDENNINELLRSYIDHVLLLGDAKEKGYSTTTPEVQKIYKEQKEEWLMQFYMSKKIDSTKLDVSTADLKQIYKQYSMQSAAQGQAMKSFEQLERNELLQLRQMAMMEKLNDQKEVYKKAIEGDYNIQRPGLDKTYVATVKAGSENIQIKKEKLDREFKTQLQMVGISEQQIKQQNPAAYEEQKKKVLEDLIFFELVKMEMKKENFENKKEVKMALDYLLENLVVQYFIEKEIIEPIPVSMDEVGSLYSKRKRTYDNSGRDLSEITDYLTKEIKNQKGQQKLESYITEKREENIIKRNKAELAKIQ